MTGAGRLAIVAAAAAGLAAGAATDALLAVAGAARVTGLQVGVAAAPLIAVALLAPVRRSLAASPAFALVVLGVAWTLAPLIDQHATGAVVVDGALPDAIHHLAGWPALVAGGRATRIHRPRTTLTS